MKLSMLDVGPSKHHRHRTCCIKKLKKVGTLLKLFTNKINIHICLHYPDKLVQKSSNNFVSPKSNFQQGLINNGLRIEM